MAQSSGTASGSPETQTQDKAQNAPHPDDDRKPDSPSDLKKPAWGYVFKRTLREFGKDQCTDLAAALTYYAVLAIFPALLALVSLLGVFGQAQTTTNTVLEVLEGVAPGARDNIGPTIENLASSSGAGLTLVIGILGALWSASAYVNAFSRAMNRIYEVEEGRPIWKLRPVMLLITAVVLLLVVLMALLLILSGPVAESVGNVIGLGDTALLVWNIAKWPVMVLFAVLMIAVLYYGAPNVKQPKFKWMSMGSFVALLVLGLTTAGFSIYVSRFGSYDQTYGAIAGVIVLLLWLWLANLSLLFGAEFDAELERGRQLQAGIEAEETLQLPPRDDTMSRKKHDKELENIDEGRELRRKYERESSQHRKND
ncbi:MULTISPECIES: YihY/virulence factor BrkB family protein [unclassified Arthrobacter]|uniref:YihY/virulence factor BrkB family protein n=1 Tax=unclassified Arthrobacter TaxID=235627 RepID=UPI0014916C2B|nr:MULTISPECIES: YihY/virulence factor BrkB family protein [unclassified Arthrobacter]MBE0009195.1 YihY/virulence factor BrkB family protein [Arthrobacter sp. AET 35A]NOJ62995.1 YihY/virulence factor BrkB family protein [Arthrobacter sp. 147(2020)]